MHFLSKSRLLILTVAEWIPSCGMTPLYFCSQSLFFLYVHPCRVEVVGDVTVVFEFFYNPFTMFVIYCCCFSLNQWFLSYAGLFELLSWLWSDKSLLLAIKWLALLSLTAPCVGLSFLTADLVFTGKIQNSQRIVDIHSDWLLKQSI